MEQRLLAAKQFIKNKAVNHPFVQSIKQRSLAPYKEPLGRALEPSSLMGMGMGRTAKLKMPTAKQMRDSILAVEDDMAQYKAIQHLNSAQNTANRIKQYQAQKTRELMARAFSGFIQRAKNMENFRNNL